jgi:phosphopantothenoylcysteine decarboxylase/phosphopantothenate--cysteine ligase
MDGSPRILLVVGGGIAAYKSCELVRLIRKAGGDVTCVLTDGGSQFVTPMSLAALSENKVYSSLWDLKDEVEMGHIELSREADLVVVCPATADLLAKMAAGIADDLGTTLILATDKPVLAIPAMNVKMWEHEATQRNVAWLREAGVRVMQPDEGEMACGDVGPGRLPEPEMVWLEIADTLHLDPGIAGPKEVTAFLEALEPEDETAELDDEEYEEEAPSRGGLGGLLASLITRATPRRVIEEVEFEDGFESQFNSDFAEAAAEVGFQHEAYEYEVVEATPDLANPLFAKKGAARAAPPTDPQALNHLVRTGTGTAAPEPIAGDHGMPQVAFAPGAEPAPAAMAKVSADSIAVQEIVEDPLAGQPGFEIAPEHRPLYGKHVLITAGPTWEAIDPVRYIANRSSGKQGFAVAAAAAALGARVTLVSGPVHLKTPVGVDRIDVESAREMADAVKKALPADAAVMIAAVSDWRSKDVSPSKIKKRSDAPPALVLTENPDILATLAGDTRRPELLIGFAAETDNLIENAKKKRKTKGCDWIVANDVSTDVMGGADNTVKVITAKDVEHWDPMSKEDVALRLMEKVADALK